MAFFGSYCLSPSIPNSLHKIDRTQNNYPVTWQIFQFKLTDNIIIDNMGSYEVRFVLNWFNHKSTDGWKTNQLINIRFCSTFDASNISWLKTATKHIVNWNEQGTGDGCNIITQGLCQEDQASVEIERI